MRRSLVLLAAAVAAVAALAPTALARDTYTSVPPGCTSGTAAGTSFSTGGVGSLSTNKFVTGSSVTLVGLQSSPAQSTSCVVIVGTLT